jgi:hypothetical protein
MRRNEQQTGPGRRPGRFLSRPAVLLLLAGLALALPRGAIARGEPTRLNTGSGFIGATDEDGNAYYFYQGLPYGSQALIHPLRLVLNGGWGITQLDNRDNRIFRIHYRAGFSNVWHNLSNPFQSIEQRGWKDFMEREVLPFSLKPGQAQYWPNYMQHLVGGGMSYRMMVEWFRYHGYGHPKWSAAATIAVYHGLNEAVENDDYVGFSTDPIADLYIFDPLSILFFSSERVSRFFGTRLHMADWSYQPLFNPFEETLENNGQNFAVRYHPPGWDRVAFFYHWGTHGEFGLSYRRANGDNVSFGVGGQAKDLVDITKGLSTVKLAVSAGLFYDRNNSLLASLLFARTKDYQARLNVYPGVFQLAGLSPGLLAALRRDGEALVGITLVTRPLLPVGLAVGF